MSWMGWDGMRVTVVTFVLIVVGYVLTRISDDQGENDSPFHGDDDSPFDRDERFEEWFIIHGDARFEEFCDEQDIIVVLYALIVCSNLYNFESALGLSSSVMTPAALNKC